MPVMSETISRLTAPKLHVEAANSDNDVMLPTKNSHLLARHLPNARLSIYPNAGHGFHFQYPPEVGAEVNAFLGS